MSFVVNALSTISNALFTAGIIVWDVVLVILNLVLPKRAVGRVTPEGHPGYGGYWPEYRPPQDGDSRCSCPALNTMANHGIIPRDGRNVKFTELNDKIRATYNFGPTICLFVPSYAANMLKKSYRKDTFDLQELDLHNGIEHDASLTRLDAALSADQGRVHPPFIEELLQCATGTDAGQTILTVKDLSKMSGIRRVQAKATNPDFSLSFFHKIFGSGNSSTMLNIFGGRVEDLKIFLLEERLPEGWESRVRQYFGLTFFKFNKTALGVEMGIREKDHVEPDNKVVV